MNSDAMRRVRETAAQLAELYAKQAELATKLAHAMRIQAWQPDAFAEGACKLAFLSTNDPKTRRAELRLATGEVRKFPLSEVPQELWPDEWQRGRKA